MKGIFGNTNSAKEIVKKQSGSLATSNLAELGQVARDNVSKEDLPRPSLRILQSNSPQISEENSKYVQGAKPGMIFNTSTREFYSGKEQDEQLVILICKYWPKVIEWLPGRKGFVAEHEIGSKMTLSENITIADENGRRVEYSKLTGNILVKTAIYYCLAFIDGETSPREVVIDMYSTNWTTAKSLNAHFENAKVMGPHGEVPGPIFTWAYQFYHRHRTDSENNNWYVWDFKPLVQIDKMPGEHQKYIEHYIKSATKYRQAVEKGDLNFDYRNKESQPDI